MIEKQRPRNIEESTRNTVKSMVSGAHEILDRPFAIMRVTLETKLKILGDDAANENSRVRIPTGISFTRPEIGYKVMRGLDIDLGIIGDMDGYMKAFLERPRDELKLFSERLSEKGQAVDIDTYGEIMEKAHKDYLSYAKGLERLFNQSTQTFTSQQNYAEVLASTVRVRNTFKLVANPIGRHLAAGIQTEILKSLQRKK